MKFGRDRHIRPVECPVCAEVLDGATCVDRDASPKPGDATMCIKCGSIVMFTRGLGLRLPTKQEQRQLAGDPRVWMIQAAQRYVMKKARH